jgi:hypothetical protein
VPPSGLTRGGLKRREPGWHLPSFGLEPPSRADWPTSARDPKAEREELDDFARGVERAHGTADESAGTRDSRPRAGGLPETRPWDGAHAGPVAGGPPYGERVPGGTVYGGTPGGRGTGHPLPGGGVPGGQVPGTGRPVPGGGVPVPGVPIPGGRVPGGPAPDHAIQGNGASPRPADAAGQTGAHTAAPEPGPTRRGGLTRRVPGAQLDSSLRDDEPTRHDDVPPTDRSHTRNPDAERAALDSFLAGLARAEQAPHDAPANP